MTINAHVGHFLHRSEFLKHRLVQQRATLETGDRLLQRCVPSQLAGRSTGRSRGASGSASTRAQGTSGGGRSEPMSAVGTATACLRPTPSGRLVAPAARARRQPCARRSEARRRRCPRSRRRRGRLHSVPAHTVARRCCRPSARRRRHSSSLTACRRGALLGDNRSADGPTISGLSPSPSSPTALLAQPDLALRPLLRHTA